MVWKDTALEALVSSMGRLKPMFPDAGVFPTVLANVPTESSVTDSAGNVVSLFDNAADMDSVNDVAAP